MLKSTSFSKCFRVKTDKKNEKGRKDVYHYRHFLNVKNI